MTAKQAEMDGARRQSLSGTPAICAKFGIDMMRKWGRHQTFVIGGITEKCGADINYSRNVRDCKRRRYERV